MKLNPLHRLGLLAFALSATTAQANLLTNPGFETNALTTLPAVLNTPSPMLPNIWGQESSVITGTVGPIVPSELTQMLAMTVTGGVATQTVQAVDVSAFSALIASGATFTLSADFNAVQQGPVGGLLMQFFGNSNYSSQILPFVSANINVDGNAASWQSHAISGAIPAGTTWMLAQVYYLEASLLDATGVVLTGYVDAADLRISPVPEPATAGLLLAGVGALGWMSRRRSRGISGR